MDRMIREGLRKSLPMSSDLFEGLFQGCRLFGIFVNPVFSLAEVLTQVIEGLRVLVGRVAVCFIVPIGNLGDSTGRRVNQYPVALAEGVMVRPRIMHMFGTYRRLR